jgi:hypothetical protein
MESMGQRMSTGRSVLKAARTEHAQTPLLTAVHSRGDDGVDGAWLRRRIDLAADSPQAYRHIGTVHPG